MYIPIATQSRPGSQAYSGERLVNYFARPASGLSQAVLLARGGLESIAELSSGPVRAVVEMGGDIYAAASGRLWRVSGGDATILGIIEDGDTTMVTDQTHVALVANNTYYVWDGAAFSSPATGAIDVPVGVAYLDGYFILIGESSGRKDGFSWSALDDPTSFDGLDFAFAEAQADALTAAIADHNELWLFGTATVQPFYNSGDADQPFLPNRGALIEHGCLAQSVAKADNAVFWTTPLGRVGRSFGSGPQWISTPEVQDEIARSTVQGAFTFTERGHEFYAIRLAGKPTLVYDMVTNLWHERAAGLEYAPWQARCSVLIGGVWHYGCDGGLIATASDTVYSDFGNVMACEVISPLQAQRGDYFRVAKLHVDFDGGLVDISRPPQTMMQVSKDGRAFGREMWRKLYPFGVYKKRAVWHALGQFRQGSIRVRVTDPVPRDLVGVAVTYG